MSRSAPKLSSAGHLPGAALEACSVVGVAAAAVGRHLRIGTQRPGSIDDAVDRSRRHDPVGDGALLNPAFEHRLHVEIVWTGAAAAMRHTGSHEQPVEAL